MVRLIDADLVNAVRAAARGRCELCGRPCRSLEVHHLIPRGIGGGKRLDHPLNLIALGGPWDCACHHKAENGKIARDELVKRIAQREKVAPEMVLPRLWALIRLPKEPHP